MKKIACSLLVLLGCGGKSAAPTSPADKPIEAATDSVGGVKVPALPTIGAPAEAPSDLLGCVAVPNASKFVASAKGYVGNVVPGQEAMINDQLLAMALSSATGSEVAAAFAADGMMAMCTTRPGAGSDGMTTVVVSVNATDKLKAADAQMAQDGSGRRVLLANGLAAVGRGEELAKLAPYMMTTLATKVKGHKADLWAFANTSALQAMTSELAPVIAGMQPPSTAEAMKAMLDGFADVSLLEAAVYLGAENADAHFNVGAKSGSSLSKFYAAQKASGFEVFDRLAGFSGKFAMAGTLDMTCVADWYAKLYAQFMPGMESATAFYSGPMAMLWDIVATKGKGKGKAKTKDAVAMSMVYLTQAPDAGAAKAAIDAIRKLQSNEVLDLTVGKKPVSISGVPFTQLAYSLRGEAANQDMAMLWGGKSNWSFLFGNKAEWLMTVGGTGGNSVAKKLVGAISKPPKGANPGFASEIAKAREEKESLVFAGDLVQLVKVFADAPIAKDAAAPSAAAAMGVRFSGDLMRVRMTVPAAQAAAIAQALIVRGDSPPPPTE